MTIAVIGWGSLIWCPRELAVQSRWRADGPRLPVEFARRSRDGRVTLVLTPGRAPVRTYWAESASARVDTAVANLRSREGCPDSRDIGSYPRHDGARDPDPGALETVAAWLDGQEGVTAAVWTALPPEHRWLDDLEQAVLDHLEGLDDHALRRAREYVGFAPRQIDTPVRRRLEDTLGWRREPLPANLFDGPDTGPPVRA